MSHILLTGATGLVGGYLLRNLFAERMPVAVVVRSTKRESAAERIDAVMRRSEELEGIALPRPVVLEGELGEANLGLDAFTRRWIARNCRSVLHNAASMVFRQKGEEPFRTNVDGVRHVLALCRESGIRELHHVSTAYICGLRTGVVRETEVDLGQENGNVYEKSKLAGEKLVREADFLDRPTIYRPASVVGDSQTGFTTSTHGFYLPLQLAEAMAHMVPAEMMGERFLELLGLEGTEGKNLVPVDWLAKAIVHLATRGKYRGRTYHLTSPHPVTVRLIQSVIQEAIGRYSRRRSERRPSEEQIGALERLFRRFMVIYRSHWRDDPIFDRTNAAAALAHLPCPKIDREMLLRIASFPVKRGFNLSEPASRQSPAAPQRLLAALVQAARELSVAAAAEDTLGLQVNGCGGGQWRLLIRDGELVGADPGLRNRDSGQLYLNADTFSLLARGRLTVDEAMHSGRLFVQRDDSWPHDPIRIFRKVLAFRQSDPLAPASGCAAEGRTTT